MVSRDTLLCILFSSLAGIGAAFFGCILSWADQQKQNNHGKHTKCSHAVNVFAVFFSVVFGFGSLAGLYFGPVNMVVMIRAGCLLPANALFSQCFGFRPLTRDDLLGTLITISGVVCFNQFSGQPLPPPSEEEFEEFISAQRSIICVIVLQVVFFISMAAIYVAGQNKSEFGSLLLVLGVTCVSGCSSAFMDVACKGWSAVLSHGVDYAWTSWRFWAALGINIIYLIGMRVSMIYGCKRCDVLVFVPLNTVLNIFFSVLVGMVIMHESDQVQTWVGLVASSLSVLGGVIMLVSGPGATDAHDDHIRNSSGNLEISDSDEEFPIPGVRTPVNNSDQDLLYNDSSRIPTAPTQSRFRSLTVNIKSEEIRRLNKRHLEVAHIRRRWSKVKEKLLDKFEDILNPQASDEDDTDTDGASTTTRSDAPR